MFKKCLTLLLVLPLLVAVFSISPSAIVAEDVKPSQFKPGLAMGADEIKQIIKEDGKIVAKGSDPEERIKSAKRLASTNDKGAYSKLEKAFKPNKVKTLDDRRVMFAVAEAMGSFSNEAVSAKLKRTIAKLKDAEDIYYAYLMMKGFAIREGKEAEEVLQSAIDEGEWLMAAALQSILESRRPSWSGKLFTIIMSAMEEVKDDNDRPIMQLNKSFKSTYLDDMNLVPVTALQAFVTTFHSSKPSEDEIMSHLKQLATLIGLLKDYDYVRYFAARAFADIAGFEEAIDSRIWLNYYLLERKQKGLGKDGMPKSKKGPTRTAVKGPQFVGMPPIGKRIVICLDVSASMEKEITDKVKEARKKREPPITGEGKGQKKGAKGNKKKTHRARIDWSKVNTKLDLAKEDLKILLSEMTSDLYFNIVVYSTQAEFLDEDTTGFVQATDANKKRFLKLAQEAETQNMTNIHGALMDAYRVTSDGGLGPQEDPATDARGIMNGANTLFFLTDGYGSWSDDSVSRVRDKRRKDTTPAVGDGQFIYGEEIMADFVRLNKFRKVIVNTIGIGEHDRHLMQDLAHESGGQYIDLSGLKPLKKKKRD